MLSLRALVVALGVSIAMPAAAGTIHGLVYSDLNGDGLPSRGEPGVANVRVAFGVYGFIATDASGQFDLPIADGAVGIVWARVPDGYVPGPAWARYDGKTDVDIALHALPAPYRGPLTFTVAADTHIAQAQDIVLAADLANAITAATALDPPPAFFTILGDITQGNQTHEFELVDDALSGLTVPFIPVPGNHDWYDGGTAWFAHYGPDNYSFDIGNVHFVVWNMAMSNDNIRRYLGAELSHVPSTMTVVALTHAPPFEPVIDTLRELGVDYVLTGHTHSNRVVDHDGVIELNTEPLLMGGLDFTPAGYRMITLDHGRLSAEHHTTVDAPFLSVVAPARGQCVQRGAELIVAAELDAGPASIVGRIDCATPIALRRAGGWNWSVELPALAPGPHSIEIFATTPTDERVTATTTIEVCDAAAPPAVGADWPQLGGDSAHRGATTHEVAPPLVTRWTTAIGGHVLSAALVIANGMVYVAMDDLGEGSAGGVVALDLVTGAVRWRATTQASVRGGVAVVGSTVVAAQIDGVVIAFDVLTGAVRWRHEMSIGIAPQAGAIFAPPAADQGDVLVGHQRAVAALAGTTGTSLWTVDPVPEGVDSQSAAAIAIADGLAVGTFNRAFGGLLAWDRATGALAWSFRGEQTVGINASPVIGDDTIFVLNAADNLTAFDLAGQMRWQHSLDFTGFEWGNATIGTPAYAHGILVVPTLYRDLVAVDGATGIELWRHAGTPSPIRTTHYRGGGEAGFEASPVITGDIVWAVDTAGELTALELSSGKPVWRTSLGVPVLAGLAVSGDWLIAASYDGTVRAFVPTPAERAPLAPTTCAPRVESGCCDTRGAPASAFGLALIVALLLRRRGIRR